MTGQGPQSHTEGQLSSYPFLTPHWLFLNIILHQQEGAGHSERLNPVVPSPLFKSSVRSRHSSTAGFDCQLTSPKLHPLVFSNTHTIQKHLRLLILSLTPFSYPFSQLYSPSLSRFIYLRVLSHHSTGTRES